MRISLRRPCPVPHAQGAPCLTMAELMALPSVTDLVSAGKALGVGRTRSYELARAGQFPCRVIRVGKTYRVPTASLFALLGISQPDDRHQEGAPDLAAARHAIAG